MDLSTVARRIARLEFAAVRLPFGLLEDSVIVRYWDEDAPLRAGFEYFLGSLDEFAGRLLDDEEIGRRGQALKRETGLPDQPEGAGPEAASPWAQAAAGGAPGTVDVTFTLPGDVQAGRVALCGDFNDWSPDATWCARAADGSWQVTVALEPGRSYRYRYLLDGERWENGGQADRYEPNPYGGVDSVIVAG